MQKCRVVNSRFESTKWDFSEEVRLLHCKFLQGIGGRVRFAYSRFAYSRFAYTLMLPPPQAASGACDLISRSAYSPFPFGIYRFKGPKQMGIKQE